MAALRYCNKRQKAEINKSDQSERAEAFRRLPEIWCVAGAVRRQFCDRCHLVADLDHKCSHVEHTEEKMKAPAWEGDAVLALDIKLLLLDRGGVDANKFSELTNNDTLAKFMKQLKSYPDNASPHAIGSEFEMDYVRVYREGYIKENFGPAGWELLKKRWGELSP
nr:hypothetical protein [Diaporthe pseudophoenicicola chrysovirus 1]